LSPSLKTNELLGKIIEHLQEGSYIVAFEKEMVIITVMRLK